MAVTTLPNVDIEKFLSSEYPPTKRTDVKWKCSDFVLSMLQDGMNADLKFTAIGGSVYAHKCVLKYVCPCLHLKVLRHKKLCKDIVKKDNKSSIQINMTIDALKLFLLLLYTTNEDVVVPELSGAIDEHFKELYTAITDFAVEERLGFVMLPAMARHLTPENCWHYYNDAFDFCHLPFGVSASEICYDYILGNYTEVIKSNTFCEQLEMKWNIREVHRIMLHAESQAARQEALRITQARCNSKTTTISTLRHYDKLL